MRLHCPVCAPMCTTSSNNDSPATQARVQRGQKMPHSVWKGHTMPHKPSFSEHFWKHHVECKPVLLICKHRNNGINVTPTTAVLKRTAPHPESSRVPVPWVMKNTAYLATTSGSRDLPDLSAISNTSFCWIEGTAFARSQDGIKAQDSSSLAEGCSPVSLSSSSLSIHTWIQQCGKLRWAAATELLFKTSLNYHQPNSETLKVIPATGTRICTLAHCIPQPQSGRTSSTHSVFQFMR